MSELQSRADTQFVFPVAELEKNMVVDIAMRSEGVTSFQVIIPGEEPVVDLLATEEGSIVGSCVRFLGSLATKYDLDDVSSSVIIARQRLAISWEGKKLPFVLAGIVGDKPPRLRMRRPRRLRSKNLC